MARIRTIKPEFPQSETIGKLSRDARLLFIQLWTIVDDDGRSRASSRLLASLLYPYDDDARELIEVWLGELQHNACVDLYEVDGNHYLQICNWLKHQKIDHPTVSKLPPIPDDFAKSRENSRSLAPDLDLVLGPSTKDQEERGGAKAQNGNYRWSGKLIRLGEPDFDRWKSAYPHIKDFTAELQSADDYYHDNPPKDGKWFFPVSSWLKRANEGAKPKIGQAAL